MCIRDSYKAPLYNAVTDFAPVGLIMDQSLILVTRKDLPPNNLQEFIAFVRQNQAKMQFGSGGVGGSNHLACVLLNAALASASRTCPIAARVLRCRICWPA